MRRTGRTHPSLLVGIGALVASSTLTVTLPHASASHRELGLGKWRDGEPTEIDCALSSHDYEYYIERCIDVITQWWINGRCVGGVKEEVSELHRCMKPDESRPFCHDCPDAGGNVKNVCGSDTGDMEEACGVAWGGTAEDCGDQGLTVYAHQCVAESGGTDHWYLREDFWCDYQEVYLSGPCMEGVPPRTEFTCGERWYYPFPEDDPSLSEMGVEVPFEDDEHPFANSRNRYCLDCGLAIQVCHAGEADTTCEDLGLTPKGVDSCVLCGTERAGAADAPYGWDAHPPTGYTYSSRDEDAQEEGAEDPGEGSSPAKTDVPEETDGTVDSDGVTELAAGKEGEASDLIPSDEDPAALSSSAHSITCWWNSVVPSAAIVLGGTTSLFV